MGVPFSMNCKTRRDDTQEGHGRGAEDEVVSEPSHWFWQKNWTGDRAHIKNMVQKFLVAAPVDKDDIVRSTPLAMRGNHLAALGEFLVSSQPWPKLRV